MPNQIVGKIPEFTSDESIQESVQTEKPQETQGEAEKETPAVPPAEPEEGQIPAPLQGSDDIGSQPVKSENELRLENQVQGLIKEVQHWRQKAQSRDLTPAEQKVLNVAEQKLDELKDVSPEDVALIDKVLKSKGYITRQESQESFYKAVENDEIGKFLSEFPEYKPENDPNDVNWHSLMREFGFYRKPDDPHQIGQLLRRAHTGLGKPSNDRPLEARRQQVKTASVGGGGVQRSSSVKSLDPETKLMLRQGGFNDEDIKKMESRIE